MKADVSHGAGKAPAAAPPPDRQMWDREATERDASNRGVLEAEKDHLLASIEDLEREHEAGDLSDADYELLRGNYTARAAEVLRALGHRRPAVSADDSENSEHAREDLDEDDSHADAGAKTTTDDADASASPAKSTNHWRKRLGRRRRVLVVGLVIVVALIAAVLVTQALTSRLPGETATGSVTLGRQQQLQRSLTQAEALESEGKAAEALRLYGQVLRQEPNQDVALAESGWLEYEAGVQAKNPKLLSQGQAYEQKAVLVSPHAFAPRLYLGSMYFVENDPADAVTQYRLFLSDHPPTSVVRSASQFIARAFSEAHQSPPPLPIGS
jgi:tetratricopeptide (TPR) repeat protein